jgi:hypothetical protein
MKVRDALYVGCLALALICATAQAGPKPKPNTKPPPTGDIVGTITVCGTVRPGVAYLDGHSSYAKTRTGSFILHAVPFGDYSLIAEVSGVPAQSFPVTLVSSQLVLSAAFCSDADSDGYDASVDCDDANSQVYPGAFELCDGLDNNCEGTVDEGCMCTVGTPCGPSNEGVCRLGTYDATCNCVGAVYPTAEVCDGLDNDCDGIVDQDIAPTMCPNQTGVCAGAAQICEAGQLLSCENIYASQPNYSETDVCGDDLDNNCDGQVDEGCQ